MPRSRKHKSQPYPAICANTAYPVLVADIGVANESLQLRLRHLAGEQDGNEHRLELAFPIRPAGALASLVCVLGMDPNDADGIDEKAFGAAAGMILRAFFLPLPDGRLLLDRVEPFEQERTHESG